MFPGGFREKLNSRSHRRASMFATAVVALHLSFLSLYPLLATFLACVSLGTGHALNFLATRWSTAACAFIICGSMGLVRDADCIRIVIVEHKVKARLYRCTRKMSVMCPFFSPNRLIDYSPAICIRLPTSTRYLRTFVKQTRNLRPTPMSFFEKAPSS